MNLTLEKAKNAAYLYILNKHNPLESNGYFSFYYVRVGEDLNRQPESVYADVLPNELSIINDTNAKEEFNKECLNSEYLLKVIIRKEKKILLLRKSQFLVNKRYQIIINGVNNCF